MSVRRPRSGHRSTDVNTDVIDVSTLSDSRGKTTRSGTAATGGVRPPSRLWAARLVGELERLVDALEATNSDLAEAYEQADSFAAELAAARFEALAARYDDVVALVRAIDAEPVASLPLRPTRCRPHRTGLGRQLRQWQSKQSQSRQSQVR